MLQASEVDLLSDSVEELLKSTASVLLGETNTFPATRPERQTNSTTVNGKLVMIITVFFTVNTHTHFLPRVPRRNFNSGRLCHLSTGHSLLQADSL